MLKDLFPDLGKRTLIMGVLNVTPDSFSDGGRFTSSDAALDQALRMMDEGADLIDIGGESTRPGAARVSVETELGRVLPVVKELHGRRIGPISIDTTKAEVARVAVTEGAHLINDVSGLAFDPKMGAVMGALGVPVVLGHARSRPENMQEGDLRYEGGVLRAVSLALERARTEVVQAGVYEADVILDPGIGFGKSVAQNLALIKNLSVLKALKSPVLVGTSRKSFLGALTDRCPAERLAGTVASVALSVIYGADFVRVHDVGAALDAVRVAEATVSVDSNV